MQTSEVHFHSMENSALSTHPDQKLVKEGLSSFSLSPCSTKLAIFISEKSDAPAVVRVFLIPNFNVPISQKVFYKGDKVEMIWNDDGNYLLALAQTDVDHTGKSYYGESNLFFLSTTQTFDCHVDLDKEGPIHDVQWIPNSNQFVVVYGHSPCKGALFNSKCEIVFDFGSSPKNFIKINRFGTLLCFAGLGNLAGRIDFWDLKAMKLVGTCQDSGASSIEWSPNGQFLFTAILSPRLRVDNGFKIWSYYGEQLCSESFKELLQISWVPNKDTLTFSKLETSGFKAKLPGKVEAYRPPSLRNSPVPSAKKVPSPSAPKGPILSAEEKEILNLSRKLKDISMLKERPAEELQDNQKEKISKETEFKKRIEYLQEIISNRQKK